MSIFHAAKSVQMPYKAKNQKITCFHNKIKNPLELRLVWYLARSGSKELHVYLARSGTWHDLVPGTIWYLARSGTWHDLADPVAGTTWQIRYLARSDLVPGTIR